MTRPKQPVFPYQRLPSPPPVPGDYAYRKSRQVLLAYCAIGWAMAIASLQMGVGVAATVICGVAGWMLERDRNRLRDYAPRRSDES